MVTCPLVPRSLNWVPSLSEPSLHRLEAPSSTGLDAQSHRSCKGSATLCGTCNLDFRIPTTSSSRHRMSQASSNAIIELFAYPWDIVERGVERFVEECQELGASVLHVTTVYHSGKFLLPRNNTHRVYFPEPGSLYVPLPRDTFGSGPVPPVSKLVGTGWLETLANEAPKVGI